MISQRQGMIILKQHVGTIVQLLNSSCLSNPVDVSVVLVMKSQLHFSLRNIQNTADVLAF